MDKPEHLSIKIKEQFTFAWEHVSYTVKVVQDKKTENKTLLFDMSGNLKSGEMCAIMGGSGAGKSTLLSILSGRVKDGTITGSITLGGAKRNPKTWANDYSLVEQDDLFHSQLTVEETLMFAANFRLPSSATSNSKKSRVNDIIMDLGLNACRNTVIGGDGLRGISGGERKRVSIAVELISNPKVLILDEPTSGLDSFTSYNVIKMIKGMAKKRNIIVLMTIHQPRNDIINMLDNILLLSAGKTLFFGSPYQAMKYFSLMGYPLPRNTNSADFFLDIVSLDQRSDLLLASSKERIGIFFDAWQNVIKDRESLNMILPRRDSNPVVNFSHYANPYVSIFYEFFVLLKRNWMIVCRDKISFYASMVSSLFVSLLMGALFWKSGTDSKGTQNKTGLLFFMTIYISFQNVIILMAKYISERQITKRERAANSYRPFSAFITKWLADVPTTVFSTLVFALPLYPMVGLRDEVDIFLVFIGVLVLHGLVSSSLGAFISVCMPNLTTGMIVGPVVVVVFLLYGGPIVNLALIPIALRWFRYVSLITNSTGALMKNEFIGAKLTCPPNSLVCFKEGKDVLKQFSLDDPPIWVDISLNAGILVAFLLFGAMMFSIKTKPLMKLK